MTPVVDLCAITLDVDAARCYREIHGLAPQDGPDPIFTRALPRFAGLLDELGLVATLFVVGRDLDNDVAKEAIVGFAAAGHEIASHSHRHDYRLSQKSRADIDADLARADEAIERTVGAAPVGFRAPGYNLSETLCDALSDRGYRYDSSLFPTPAYFGLRGAALAAYRWQGRRSHSLLGDVREFVGPQHPFVPDRQARFRPANGRPGRAYVEIPITTPRLFPWLGTTLAMMPRPAGRALSGLIARQSDPVVLELHAMDFADAEDGYEPALVEAQPDLSVPVHKKMARLRAAFVALTAHRHTLPLRDFPAV